MLAHRGLLVRARTPLVTAFVSGPAKSTLTLSAPQYLWQLFMFAHRALLLRARAPLLLAFASGPK